MMLNQIKKRLHSRQHAGRLLSEKLLAYRHADALTLAIPRGGIPVGQQIAAILELPFEVIPSRRIKHPAHSDQSIGAVCLDEVVLHETAQFIPQHYVLHQINLLQKALLEDLNRYFPNKSQRQMENKTVILVDDVLRETDELEACLQNIFKHNPSKVVVAAAVASAKATHFLVHEGIEFHYLFTEFNQQNKAYTYFSEVTEEEVLLPSYSSYEA
jgi:putative phosphoribosyl transferase